MAEIPNCFDKVDYYFEDALKNYCFMFSKNESSLTDGDYNEIMRYAGNHIGFFIAWLIRRGELCSMHTGDPNAAAAAERVKRGELLGVDFLMEFCGGRLLPEDMSDKMALFAAEFYEGYFKIYSEFVINELDDLPFEFIGSWEDYLAFEPVLDRHYENAAGSDNAGSDRSAPGNTSEEKSDTLNRKWKLL